MGARLLPGISVSALAVLCGMGLIACGDADGDTAGPVGSAGHGGSAGSAGSSSDAAVVDGSSETGSASDGSAGGSADAGPDGPPYRVPDILTHAKPPLGKEPGVIFRWRADGTSTTPGVLSDGVQTIEVKRTTPFSSFRYADFHGVSTGASPGYLGNEAIQVQPDGFTVQAWFRARSVDGTRTLFSNTGSNKGISFDLIDGRLHILFSTDDGGTAYRHNIQSDSTSIESGKWYAAAVSVAKETSQFRVAFFVDGTRAMESNVPFDHGSVLLDSTERPAVAAEPNSAALSGEGFDGAMHAVMVLNHPVSDDILGSPWLRDGGRYFGMPSYHDYLTVPEPSGTSTATPPYSDRRINFARRIGLTDRDARFPGLRKARTRLGLPLANDRFMPGGVALSQDGKTMWLGFHYVSTDGANPDGYASMVGEADLPSYQLTRVYRLLDTSGTPLTTAIGGLTRAGNLLYATVGSKVLAFNRSDAVAEAQPDQDMPDAPAVLGLKALKSFDVRTADAALAWDQGANALWLSGPSADGAFLDRYDLAADGAIANPSTTLSDERLVPPSVVKFVHGVTPIDLGAGRCFLLASHDNAAVGAGTASRINLWCEGNKTAAARLQMSSGAAGLAVGPDGTLWIASVSGAAFFQKRISEQQWYDVLTPYVTGYDSSVLAPTIVNCQKGDMQPYLGDVHTHSSYSDGTLLPSDVFKTGRDTAKLDYMLMTDHGGSLTTTEYSECKKQASALTSASFIASCGYEVAIKPASGTTYDHHNRLFAGTHTSNPANISELYDDLVACSGCVGQMNHPASTTYPWKDEAWSSKADAQMALCELSGGAKADAIAKYHSLLGHGWHLAPSCNSDTHDNAPGNGGKRTGIFATGLDAASIKQAMEQRRTFAGNAGNGASIRLMAEDCWMGARLQGYVHASFFVEAIDSAVGFTGIELVGKDAQVVHKIDCQDKTTCSETVALETDPAWKYLIAIATRSDGRWMISAPVWLED